MGQLAIIQAAQTAVLLTVAGAVIYALYLLQKELRQAANALAAVLRGQKEIEASIERLWKRIDEIEISHGLRIDFEELSRIKRLLDALEAAGKRPPLTAQRPDP